MNEIRKLSVGADYKSAMHYVLGQSVLNGDYVIHQISESQKEFFVWIESEGEVILWKKFNSLMPVSCEYNIDF